MDVEPEQLSPQEIALIAGDVEYLFSLPEAIPQDRILVHNRVRPAKPLGRNGFRCWLTSLDDERHEVCGCGWAADLGTHYRMRLSDLRNV